MDLPIMTTEEFQKVAERFGMTPEQYQDALAERETAFLNAQAANREHLDRSIEQLRAGETKPFNPEE
jgi:hypothetical protein